jgi:hypothetical protein
MADQRITDVLAIHNRGPVRTVGQYRYDKSGSTSRIKLKLVLGKNGTLLGDDVDEIDLKPTRLSDKGLANKISLPDRMPVTAAVLLGALANVITSLADDRAALSTTLVTVHELQLVEGSYRLPSKTRIEFTLGDPKTTAKGRLVYEITREATVGTKVVRLLTLYARGKVGIDTDPLTTPKDFEYFDVVRKVIYDWAEDLGHWRVCASKGDVLRVADDGTELEDSSARGQGNVHAKYFKDWANYNIQFTDLPFPPELRISETRNEDFRVDWSIESLRFHIYCDELGGTTYCQKEGSVHYISIENDDLKTLDHDKWHEMHYKLYEPEPEEKPEEKPEAKKEDADYSATSGDDSDSDPGECTQEGCKRNAYLQTLCSKHYRRSEREKAAKASRPPLKKRVRWSFSGK